MIFEDNASFAAVRDLLNCTSGHGKQAPVDEAVLRFGTANALFSAPFPILTSMGFSESDARLISCMRELSRYSDRTDIQNPFLGSLPTAARYLTDSLCSLSMERFCLLCLDARGKLMSNITLQDGTDDTALFSLKEMLAAVIHSDPSAVILSHNHPRHTLHPSREDIDCTIQALRALTVLQIPMLDHIIIAGRQAVSIRDNGFIPVDLWIDQDPESKLLREWLLN